MKTSMLGHKQSNTLIKVGKKNEDMGTPIDKERKQRLVGKMTYLSHTERNIIFVVSVIS